MLSNRDDKKGEHEESEYHFSDEDVSYEIESDTSKTASSGGSASNVLSRLSSSKRMLISLGVFIVLVFIVYKMVAPGATVPSTDIVSGAPPVSAMPMTAAAPAQAPTEPAPSPAQPPAQELAAPPVMSVAPENQQSPTMMPEAIANAGQQPQPQAPAAPAQVAPTQAQMQAPQQAPAQTEPPRSIEQGPEVVVSMPPVIPVQSNVPASPAQVVVTSPPTGMDAAITSMAATNEKLMNQLQSDYTQRISEYSNQNKEMQGQIQTLNSRVANIEAQMNQLMQVLTHGGSQAPAASAPGSAPPPPPAPAVPVSAAPEIKVSYSVQAIIPGRAWLRSENGETVTVAEGDTIKDLGKVTKIDPYDGIVEVNIGNRVVSISYGNAE